MLLSLSIRDVVLIDRLDLTFRPGLCVLTGETGAGKSILLDALGLALGARADTGLIRRGAERAVVGAEFATPADHPLRRLLDEQGLEAGDALVLRRVLGADGRSRAFVDDQPVSVNLLRRLGEELVEIEGQFAQRGLLDSATHRTALDAFGGLEDAAARVADAYRAWRRAAAARAEAEAGVARAKGEAEALRHAVAELDALDPQPGEEARLAETRSLLMHQEKLVEALGAASAELEGERGVEEALGAARRHLDRVADKAGGRLDAALAALDRAAVELDEALSALRALGADLDLDPRRLEEVEERLFTLRATARKHTVEVDALPALRQRLTATLAAIEGGGDDLPRLVREEEAARAAYREAALDLGDRRRVAAAALDKAAAAELPPLRLEKATFRTLVERRPEEEWDSHGADRVAFEVTTNPGMPAGPLARIASGGELSRFMLALKVVLSRANTVPSLVFDEVDSGIGGAAAAAVGERLARLGREVQVLVVTHSPQVAARGAHHLCVRKEETKGGVVTRVDDLAPAARREEIARLLSGAQITEEARAAADSLMEGVT